MRSVRLSSSEKISISSLARSRRSRMGVEVAGVVVERLLDGQEPVEVQLLRGQADGLAGVAIVADQHRGRRSGSIPTSAAEPVAQWIRVDLPALFGPRSPKISPTFDLGETLCSASTPVG